MAMFASTAAGAVTPTTAGEGAPDDSVQAPIDVSPKTTRNDGVTVGWNCCMNPQVKLTMDWGLNSASLGAGAFEANGIGYRVDEPEADHQWSLRTQLQLLF